MMKMNPVPHNSERLPQVLIWKTTQYSTYLIGSCYKYQCQELKKYVILFPGLLYLSEKQSLRSYIEQWEKKNISTKSNLLQSFVSEIAFSATATLMIYSIYQAKVFLDPSLKKIYVTF